MIEKLLTELHKEINHYYYLYPNNTGIQNLYYNWNFERIWEKPLNKIRKQKKLKQIYIRNKNELKWALNHNEFLTNF